MAAGLGRAVPAAARVARGLGAAVGARVAVSAAARAGIVAIFPGDCGPTVAEGIGVNKKFFTAARRALISAPGGALSLRMLSMMALLKG
jgi:hypothetical protein